MNPLVLRLRELLQARPFQPFNMVMVDGLVCGVPHEDFLSVTRSGAVIYDDGERMKTINPMVVSRIDESVPAAGK